MSLSQVIYTVGFENSEGAKENHSYTLQTGNIYISEDASWYLKYDEENSRWTLNDISQEHYYAFYMMGTWYYSTNGVQSEGYVIIPEPVLKTSTPSPNSTVDTPAVDTNTGSFGSGSSNTKLEHINSSYIYNKTNNKWLKN